LQARKLSVYRAQIFFENIYESGIFCCYAHCSLQTKRAAIRFSKLLDMKNKKKVYFFLFAVNASSSAAGRRIGWCSWIICAHGARLVCKAGFSILSLPVQNLLNPTQFCALPQLAMRRRRGDGLNSRGL
jgi:hypothetical protein